MVIHISSVLLEQANLIQSNTTYQIQILSILLYQEMSLCMHLELVYA